MSHANSVIKGYILPTQPQILLAADKNQGYQKLRLAFEKVKEEIDTLNPDVLIIYATSWPSILGTQIQAKEKLKWTFVDDEWHELGEIPYEFKMDRAFAKAWCEAGKKRGLHIRTVEYDGFPIDAGSVTALELLNKGNPRPAVIVSSNIYADRSETVVLAKACRDALKAQGKRSVFIASTMLSNRSHTDVIDLSEDHIRSAKDQEWNLKLLEFFSQGRLEDAAQLSRQFHKEARVHKVNNFKPLWFMSGLMGSSNHYKGEVLEYQPVYGMGAAVISMTPSEEAFGDLEYDEEDPEFFLGDRGVLSSHNQPAEKSAQDAAEEA